MKLTKKILICLLIMMISVFYCGEYSNAAIYTYKKYKGIVYSEDFRNGIVVTNYRGNKKKLSIPTKINGKEVVEVTKLKNANKLEQLHIPATVDYIGISQAPALKKLQ